MKTEPKQTITNKINLITRDLQEIIGQEEIAAILAQRPLKIYLGSAPTGKPHLGYFVWILKVADFLRAGCEVTLLLADLHAYLDNMKSTWDQLEHRVKFYKMVFTKMLEIAEADISKLKFVRGTDYQLSKKYSLDVYRAAATTSLRDAKKAGAEVVKQVEFPLLSSMLYPILQAIDEEYLGVDAQMGGVDQRKIFTFAREHLPKLGYKKRIHLLTPLVPGLTKSGKMSSSEPNSKIDFDDDPDVIREKFNKSYSIDGEVSGNGLLAICKFVIFKIYENSGKTFKISRPEKWGGDVEYISYNQLEKDFVNKKLASIDLKPAVAEAIIQIVTPLREMLKENTKLVNLAYHE